MHFFDDKKHMSLFQNGSYKLNRSLLIDNKYLVNMNEGILFEIIGNICSCRQQAVKMYTRDYKRIFEHSERYL